MDTTPTAPEHNFPQRAGEYVRIGLILFVLTALEVGAYEISHRPGVPMHDFLATGLIPVLLVLSAMKFALVALFYMHLKWDGRLLKGIFGFSLGLATFVIVAMIALAAYQIRHAAVYGALIK